MLDQLHGIRNVGELISALRQFDPDTPMYLNDIRIDHNFDTFHGLAGLENRIVTREPDVTMTIGMRGIPKAKRVNTDPIRDPGPYIIFEEGNRGIDAPPHFLDKIREEVYMNDARTEVVRIKSTDPAFTRKSLMDERYVRKKVHRLRGYYGSLVSLPVDTKVEVLGGLPMPDCKECGQNLVTGDGFKRQAGGTGVICKPCLYAGEPVFPCADCGKQYDDANDMHHHESKLRCYPCHQAAQQTPTMRFSKENKHKLEDRPCLIDVADPELFKRMITATTDPNGPGHKWNPHPGAQEKFMNAGVRTGRFSASEPNIEELTRQAIPINPCGEIGLDDSSVCSLGRRKAESLQTRLEEDEIEGTFDAHRGKFAVGEELTLEHEDKIHDITITYVNSPADSPYDRCTFVVTNTRGKDDTVAIVRNSDGSPDCNCDMYSVGHSPTCAWRVWKEKQ